MSLRVLHVFGIMNRGGAELRTLSLVEEMKNRGVHFDYCVLSGQQGVLDKQIQRQGGVVHYCKLNFSFFWRFYRLLRTQQYDVVHSHVSLVSGIILSLARIAGTKKRIAHFRNTHDKAEISSFRKIRNMILSRMLLSSATKVLAVCAGALNGYWHRDWHLDQRFAVLYNGFDFPDISKTADFWSPYFVQPNSAPVIINVARMDYQKNHLRQVRIFSIFLHKHPEAHMVFVGKEASSVKQSMLDYAEQYKISNRLIFAGEQANVLPFLVNANVLLFPSMWEGLPGVVIESAAMGTPVLASKIPGVEEIASQLPIVRPFELSRSDKDWADQLSILVTNNVNCDETNESFSNSEFLLSANVEKLYGYYCG